MGGSWWFTSGDNLLGVPGGITSNVEEMTSVSIITLKLLKILRF